MLIETKSLLDLCYIGFEKEIVLGGIAIAESQNGFFIALTKGKYSPINLEPKEFDNYTHSHK